MPRPNPQFINPSAPSRSKYRAAFDRGTTAASAGLPLSADPYGADAPVASRYWRRGWKQHVGKHEGYVVEEDANVFSWYDESEDA